MQASGQISCLFQRFDRSVILFVQEQRETGGHENGYGRSGVEPNGRFRRLDGFSRLPGIGQHRGKCGIRLGVTGAELDRHAGRGERCLVLAVHRLSFG